MYVKVFETIFDGSLYGQFEPTVVFLAMLVIAKREGIVDMTPQAIAARCGYPLDIVERGIHALEQPDPLSRTPDEDGRRIVRLEEHRNWGWRITNYEKYEKIRSAAERREYFRTKRAEYRARDKKEKSTLFTSSSTCSPPNPNLHPNLHPQKDKEPEVHLQMQTIKGIYPKAARQDWITAEKLIRNLVTSGEPWQDIIDGVGRYARLCKATNRAAQNPGLFFGAIDQPWRQEWPLPLSKADTRLDANVDVMRQFVAAK